MTAPRRESASIVTCPPATMSVAALGVALIMSACTAATPDTPGSGGSGVTATGGSTAAGGVVGSGGSPASGSGGLSGSAGAPGVDSGGAIGSGSAIGSSGGAPGTGGGPPGSTGGSGVIGPGGAGASAATGGRSGTGGAPGTGGGTVVKGCDWANTAGRIVLFDGTSLNQWKNLKTGGPAQWKLIGDGTMEVVPLEPPTDIQSTMKFENLCVHVEYMTPTYPSNITGQQRGNSGVFLKSAYEMQILDSIGQPPDINTCGAVYSISPPLVVACNMELVWNTYEIEFKASVWDATGKKTKNAVFVAATLNGKLVQQNVDLNPAGGFTQAGQPDVAGPQPLMLQDHRNLVRFRNIWVKVPQY